MICYGVLLKKKKQRKCEGKENHQNGDQVIATENAIVFSDLVVSNIYLNKTNVNKSIISDRYYDIANINLELNREYLHNL